jgi:formylmethanofuran dehydrogenase subunit A
MMAEYCATIDNGGGTRTIDATGMVIFPGGVDVHTHVAGGALRISPVGSFLKISASRESSCTRRAPCRLSED